MKTPFWTCMNTGYIYSAGYIYMCHDLPFMQGQSWSIGADNDSQTVFSFLRFYTPGIIGGSLGDHLAEVGHVCQPCQFHAYTVQ